MITTPSCYQTFPNWTEVHCMVYTITILRLLTDFPKNGLRGTAMVYIITVPRLLRVLERITLQKSMQRERCS